MSKWGNIDSTTSRQAGDFLFSLEQDSKALEMRSRVMGREMYSALLFYGILRDYYKSKSARIVGDIIKRLSIANEGLGRQEAVKILQGELPREIEIQSGVA